MKNNTSNYLLFISLMLLISFSVRAQQDLTIHHMSSIPQSYYNNPSFVPEAKFYLGMPALSSLYFDVSNNALSLKHLLTKTATDSVEIDVNNFVDHLYKRNALSFHFQEEILTFGFKAKKNYFNLSLTSKTFFEFSYPKDLMGFFLKGNISEDYLGKTADLSGLGADATAYHDLSIGYSREIDKTLTVGGRVKVLFGVLNAQSKKTDLTINTADESELNALSLSSSFELNSNLMPLMTNDDIDEVEVSDIMGTKNMGFGLDLGGTYRMSEDITVSASVLDLAFISWKSNPMNVQYKNKEANFTFEGVEMTELFGSNEGDSTDFFADLADSIMDIFEIESTEQKYTTYLPTKILLSATYNLTEKDKVGGLLRTEFWKGTPRAALSLSYQRYLGKMLLLSASYSIRNKNYTNIGFGFAANLGPIQLYLVTDNVLGPIIMNEYVIDDEGGSVPLPASTRNLNFHFGMNFVFGYKNKDDVKFSGKKGNDSTKKSEKSKDKLKKDKKGNGKSKKYEDKSEKPKGFKDEELLKKNQQINDTSKKSKKKTKTKNDDKND